MEKCKIKDLKIKGFNKWSACLINKLIVEEIITDDEQLNSLSTTKLNYSISNYNDFIDYFEALDDIRRCCNDFEVVKIIIETGLSSRYIEEGESVGSYLLDTDYLLNEVKDIYYGELKKLPSIISEHIDWEAVLDDCLSDYTEYDGVYFYDYI